MDYPLNGRKKGARGHGSVTITERSFLACGCAFRYTSSKSGACPPLLFWENVLESLSGRSTVSNRCGSANFQCISVSLPEKPASPSLRMFEGTPFPVVDRRSLACHHACI